MRSEDIESELPQVWLVCVHGWFGIVELLRMTDFFS